MTTFDAVTSGKITSNGSSCTFAHTISSNSNRVLLVFATGDKITDTGVTLSCTYGGVAMSSLGTRHSGDDTNGFMTAFLLINPASGTANVVVTQSVSTGRISAGAMSFSDASQTAGDYTLTSAANSEASRPVATLLNGKESVDVIIARPQPIREARGG